jgi:hypothetical protein
VAAALKLRPPFFSAQTLDTMSVIGHTEYIGTVPT